MKTSDAKLVDPLGPVFVSYRQSDGRGLAISLAWALRAAGVPVWHDLTDLPPGETARRLEEALASGLSGAILVVTPQIAESSVVRTVELPSLLDLADDPNFTLSIISTIAGDSAGALDYSAPDRLLGTPEGTLSAIHQAPSATESERAAVAQAQVRQRLEHLRPDIANGGGVLLIELQTRVPPFAAQHDAHLVVRLRPPIAGQRRPPRVGLADLRAFLGQLPQLIAIAGASSVRVRGGAHLSVACAFGAAMPTTLLGGVEAVDTADVRWRLDGQAPAPGAEPLIIAVDSTSHNGDRGPVLVYVDMLSQRSDAAFLDLIEATHFAGVLHLRPAEDGLLEPRLASQLVGEVTAAMRELADIHRTTEIHVLLRCPYPLALLIGRSLNTLTVHLYEWDDSDELDETGPRYIPSLVLRSGAGGSPIHQISAPPDHPSPLEF